jgi:hypothetical protein
LLLAAAKFKALDETPKNMAVLHVTKLFSSALFSFPPFLLTLFMFSHFAIHIYHNIRMLILALVISQLFQIHGVRGSVVG